MSYTDNVIPADQLPHIPFLHILHSQDFDFEQKYLIFHVSISYLLTTYLPYLTHTSDIININDLETPNRLNMWLKYQYSLERNVVILMKYLCSRLWLILIFTSYILISPMLNSYSANTKRNKHVIIKPKRRFGVIITCLLRCVFAG